MTNVCILCNNKKFQTIYKINEFTIVICKNCNLIFTNPWPNKKDLEKLYKNFKFDAGFIHEHLVRRDARRILNNIKSLGKTPRNLLDLGCGAGFLLDEAQKTGWDTVGIDTASYPLKYAKEQLHLNVIKKDIHRYQSKTKFDAIILSQVIEHLPNPYPILNKINTLLADDGVACISTPNITSHLAKILKDRFNYLIPPDHVLYFSPITLKQILEKSGFKVIKIITYGYPEDFGAIYRALREKPQKPSSVKARNVNVIKNKNELNTRPYKSIKNYIFENIIRNNAYPLLNIGLKGSMIEAYITKQ